MQLRKDNGGTRMILDNGAVDDLRPAFD